MSERMKPTRFARTARVRGWVLAWALGVPIPILILIYVLRGCQ